MSNAANELMWIKQLCTDLSITVKRPTLWGDNKSANLLAVNHISSDRSKHIRMRNLRVREYVEHDEMGVQWVGRKEMLADGFTKTLSGLALSNPRDKLHLRKMLTLWGSVVIYMHTVHEWLTVQMLWQMYGRTLQAVHKLIVSMGIFYCFSPPVCGDCTGS